MNTRLLRYSRYQLPDFLLQRLTLPLVLLAFAAGLPTYLMMKNTPPGWMQSPQGINLARQMFSQSITLYLPLGAFVGAVGVISSDRQQGYFRFLFSKPVNVLAYYAQTYLLHAIVYGRDSTERGSLDSMSSRSSSSSWSRRPTVSRTAACPIGWS